MAARYNPQAGLGARSLVVPVVLRRAHTSDQGARQAVDAIHFDKLSNSPPFCLLCHDNIVITKRRHNNNRMKNARIPSPAVDWLGARPVAPCGRWQQLSSVSFLCKGYFTNFDES